MLRSIALPVFALLPMAALMTASLDRKDWVELVMAVMGAIATWFLARKKPG